MKRHKNHIIHSWLLLICFVAGQYLVHTHRHTGVRRNGTSQIAKNTAHQSVTEKCWLCDAMHHNFVAAAIASVISAAPVSGYVFKHSDHSFTSIQPILLTGRAPPEDAFSI